MRYTKLALLTFGAGLVLALVAVAVDIEHMQRMASTAMALGIAAIPDRHGGRLAPGDASVAVDLAAARQSRGAAQCVARPPSPAKAGSIEPIGWRTLAADRVARHRG
jgi:hypothetical protein